jgi:broad specificity phosphatase PhoE
MLRNAGVTHCFATELKRTRQTLQPLADAIELEIDSIAAADPNALVERVRALPSGSVAVVAGHSNTVPAIVRGLGGELSRLQGTPSGDQLPDAEYGRLMLLLLAPPGAPERAVLRSLELHVGDP